MQLENAYSPFRCVSPLLYYQYLWVGESGKSPWYLRGWRLWFYKISNSPTPFLQTQNNVANFPPPRGREANSSPCIPRHIPLVGPGSYPRGKPMTCALELATQLISHHASIFLGVIILGMNKPRPWKCPWTSSKKRKKRTKNENTAMNEQAKVDGKLKLRLSAGA